MLELLTANDVDEIYHFVNQRNNELYINKDFLDAIRLNKAEFRDFIFSGKLICLAEKNALLNKLIIVENHFGVIEERHLKIDVVSLDMKFLDDCFITLTEILDPKSVKIRKFKIYINYSGYESMISRLSQVGFEIDATYTINLINHFELSYYRT